MGKTSFFRSDICGLSGSAGLIGCYFDRGLFGHGLYAVTRVTNGFLVILYISILLPFIYIDFYLLVFTVFELNVEISESCFL